MLLYLHSGYSILFAHYGTHQKWNIKKKTTEKKNNKMKKIKNLKKTNKQKFKGYID